MRGALTFAALLFLLSCRPHTLDLRTDRIAVTDSDDETVPTTTAPASSDDASEHDAAASTSPPTSTLPPTVPTPSGTNTGGPPDRGEDAGGIFVPPAMNDDGTDGGEVECDPFGPQPVCGDPEGRVGPLVCDPDEHVCRGCLADRECGTFLCNRMSGRCEGCRGFQRDCGFEKGCFGGSCLAGCAVNDDCHVGDYCAHFERFGSCEPCEDGNPNCIPCFSDDECRPFDGYCARGRCDFLPPWPPPYAIPPEPDDGSGGNASMAAVPDDENPPHDDGNGPQPQLDAGANPPGSAP